MKPNEVLDKLIESMERGVLPWKRGWETSGGGLPTNPSTGRDYSGSNIMILWAEQAEKGYSSSAWLGFNQGSKLGGSVRKCEKSTYIILYRPYEKENDKGELETFGYITTKPIFNIDQFDGLDHLKQPVATHEWTPVEAVERLLIQSGAVIEYGTDRPCYVPSVDKIRLPERNRFHSPESFSATALHELTHWTGHASRLNRTKGKRFGDDAYAYEELVAECGSAFVQAKIGLQADVEYHASYLDSWLGVLKKDRSVLMHAASAASKAADYMINQNKSVALDEAA